jgi:hypothetical protein
MGLIPVTQTRRANAAEHPGQATEVGREVESRVTDCTRALTSVDHSYVAYMVEVGVCEAFQGIP